MWSVKVLAELSNSISSTVWQSSLALPANRSYARACHVCRYHKAPYELDSLETLLSELNSNYKHSAIYKHSRCCREQNILAYCLRERLAFHSLKNPDQETRP